MHRYINDLLKRELEKFHYVYCEKDYVVVRDEYFQELLRAREFLSALDAAGVDNWEGYDRVNDYLPDDYYEH